MEKLEKAISNIDSLDYTIFFAKPKWVGHDRRGLPIYRKNIDGSESDDILCDFAEYVDMYDYTENAIRDLWFNPQKKYEIKKCQV